MLHAAARKGVQLGGLAQRREQRGRGHGHDHHLEMLDWAGGAPAAQAPILAVLAQPPACCMLGPIPATLSLPGVLRPESGVQPG